MSATGTDGMVLAGPRRPEGDRRAPPRAGDMGGRPHG